MDENNIKDDGLVKDSKSDFAATRKDLAKFMNLDPKQAQRMLDIIRYVSGEKIKDYLSGITEDVRTIHARLQTLILKETVLTEVSYSHRHDPNYTDVVVALVWALNLPDQWWKDGGDTLTLPEWSKRISQAWACRPQEGPGQSTFHIRMERS